MSDARRSKHVVPNSAYAIEKNEHRDRWDAKRLEGQLCAEQCLEIAVILLFPPMHGVSQFIGDA